MSIKGEVVKALLVGNADKVQSGFVIGESVLIRTLTYHSTGRVVAVCGDFVVLEDAAWIADTGRFTQAINDGALSEVEPVNGPVRVKLSNIVDVFHWAHPLPREQK